jgi:hypothetical protein
VWDGRLVGLVERALLASPVGKRTRLAGGEGVTGGEGDTEIWSLNDRGDRSAPSESQSGLIETSDLSGRSRLPDITRFLSSREAQGGSFRFDACDVE